MNSESHRQLLIIETEYFLLHDLIHQLTEPERKIIEERAKGVLWEERSAMRSDLQRIVRWFRCQCIPFTLRQQRNDDQYGSIE